MTFISKYISYTEATKSEYAIRNDIPNVPTDENIEAMQLVGQKLFDRVREHFGKPIGVTSFYRSQALNKAIGGSVTSQHTSGEAIDIDADVYGGVTNKEIFDFIKDNLTFDQLIWEFGNNDNPDWVHVSYAPVNRGQVLRAIRSNGKTTYQTYR